MALAFGASRGEVTCTPSCFKSAPFAALWKLGCGGF